MLAAEELRDRNRSGMLPAKRQEEQGLAFGVEAGDNEWLDTGRRPHMPLPERRQVKILVGGVKRAIEHQAAPNRLGCGKIIENFDKRKAVARTRGRASADFIAENDVHTNPIVHSDLSGSKWQRNLNKGLA
jgi:hypothetical protein